MPIVSLLLAACKPEATDPAAALLELPAAGGIALAKVSLYQGIEIPLHGGGRATVPIVAERDGFVRGFVEPGDGFAARELTGVLVVNGPDGETVLSDTRTVTDASTDRDLDSTFNFDVPASQLDADTTMELRIAEASEAGPGGGDGSETWSGDVEAEAAGDVTLVIIPLRYQADGSGRLPDTSDEQIARIRDRMASMYPLRDLTVRVDPVQNWTRPIEAFDGNDWSAVLGNIAIQRATADEPDSTYYYGLFAPAESQDQYCRFGCILGLSLLAQSMDPLYRASVGLGYPGKTTANTIVHEVGHAHGREHAPCGLGGQPSDPRYPNRTAAIGVWGYDRVEGELHDPDKTVDMMSYCSPIWLSDYTYEALFERIASLNRGDSGASARRVRPTSRPVWTVGDDGVGTPLGDLPVRDRLAGRPVAVDLVDGAGRVLEEASGRLVPFGDPIGSGGVLGGWLTVDGEVPDGLAPRLAAGG